MQRCSWSISLVNVLLAAVVTAILLGLPTLASTQEAPPSASVIAARVGVHPDKTRFVLETSQRVTLRATLQGDPYRMVIDLPELAWPGAEKPRAGNGVIRSYHVEQLQPGSLRLVLELTGPVRIGTAMVMEPSEGHQSRLVLDLARVTPDAFQPDVFQPDKGLVRSDHSPPVITAFKTTPKPVVSLTPPTLPSPALASPSPPALATPALATPALANPARATPARATKTPNAVASSPPISLIPLIPIARSAPQPDQTPADESSVPQPPAQSPALRLASPALRLTSMVPPPSPPGIGTKPRRIAPAGKPMIALDPGHGGIDPGATGINGIHEKDITLATALEVRRQLEATGRFRVMMTREDDEFVALRERVARARQAGADLLISMHADSIAKSAIRGMSIYTLSDKGSDHEAEMLAAKENRADAIGGIDLSNENDLVASILIDLAQRDTRNHSRRLATLVLREAGHGLKLLPTPDRSAAFAVLTAPDVPSVLIEMGYLSSPEDAMLLTHGAHRQRLATALVHAIDGYFVWLTGTRRS
ncbi:MAG: N-acetylmuramoyl-L-alanine amidase [Rhodospirillaceae bacterium]